jgi:arginase family enzyme
MAVPVAMSNQNLNRQYTESSNPLWPDLKSQPHNFFKASLCTDLEDLNAEGAFIGMPFDQGTFGRTSTRFGPDAIRDAPGPTPTASKRRLKGFDIDNGGDHAITYPVMRGLNKFAPLNIVHFDAHLDYSHDYQGVLHTHGSPVCRCRELPFVNHITSAGIRTARRQPTKLSKTMGV